MSLRQIRHALSRSLAKRGLWKTVIFGSRRVLGVSTRPDVREIQHPLDLQHGIQTSGVLFRKEGSDRHAYHGIAPSIFREACRRWQKFLPEEIHSIKEYNFVDLGCGMGRALLLASEMSFRQVEGVEFDGELIRIAQENIRKWVTSGLAGCPIVIHHMDALEYAIPHPPVLVFLYNPFGEKILEAVLRRLSTMRRESGSTIDILYIHPKHDYLLGDRSKFELLWSERLPFDDRDREANEFGARSEVCALYRLREIAM